MKRLFYVLAVLFISTISFSQNLLVANNNPGAASGVNVFTAPNALINAEAAAVAGDIIYVVPSQVVYGSVTITKGITVFGIGINPTKDLANKSIIKQIDINADNVRISGMVVEQDVQLGLTLSGVTISNTIIENCRLGRIEMGSANGVSVAGLVVRNNVFTGYGSVATSLLLYTTSGVTITNNVIITSCCTANSMRVTGAMIQYNVFLSDGNRGIDADLVNNTLDHNIFYGTNVNLQATSTGNVWTNNLSFGSSQMVFGSGSSSNGTIAGNLENIDPMFANAIISYTWSDGYDFSLLTGSPALGLNNGTGEDMGTSGGPTPFDAEGNLLPLIQSVTIPATIPVGTDLPVTIKAKGN